MPTLSLLRKPLLALALICPLFLFGQSNFNNFPASQSYVTASPAAGLQAAINACTSLSSCNDVYLPAGLYTSSALVTCTPSNNGWLRIRGAGQDPATGTVLRFTGATGGIILGGSCTIEDVDVDTSNASAGTGLRFSGLSQFIAVILGTTVAKGSTIQNSQLAGSKITIGDRSLVTTLANRTLDGTVIRNTVGAKGDGPALWDFCGNGAGTNGCLTIQQDQTGVASFTENGLIAAQIPTGVSFGGSTLTDFRSARIGTVNNCANSGGTCSNASSGAVTIAASASTATVSTTAVTANSQILITEDSTLGTRLSVTCNTTTGRTYSVTTRTAGTSFVITTNSAPTTNPACLNWTIIN